MAGGFGTLPVALAREALREAFALGRFSTSDTGVARAKHQPKWFEILFMHFGR